MIYFTNAYRAAQKLLHLEADCYIFVKSFSRVAGELSNERRTAWRISLPIPALAALSASEVSRGHDQRQVEGIVCHSPEVASIPGVCDLIAGLVIPRPVRQPRHAHQAEPDPQALVIVDELHGLRVLAGHLSFDAFI